LDPNAQVNSTDPLTLSDVEGSILYISPLAASLVNKTIPPTGVVMATKNARATINGTDGSQIGIQSETVLSLYPMHIISGRNNKVIVFAKGNITYSNQQQTQTDYNYEFRTAIGKIKTSADSAETQFTLDYHTAPPTKKNQSQQIGEISITVTTGTVDFYSAEGEKTVLTNGREYLFDDLVTRSMILLPVDGGEIYTGNTNYFIWTAYDEANQYLYEYGLPDPGFSQGNAEGVEFLDQILTIAPSIYTLWEDLVIFPLTLPEIEAINMGLEFRIFPLDTSEEIIPYAVSSDKHTMTITN